MRIEDVGGQVSLFGPDMESGRMSPGCTARRGARTSGSSWSRSSKLKNRPLMLLDLRPGAGNLLGLYWEYNPAWLGPPGTLNTSECPSGAEESSLWQILQAAVPSRYYSSPRACRGILRRAEARGRTLPEELEAALRLQGGVPPEP